MISKVTATTASGNAHRLLGSILFGRNITPKADGGMNDTTPLTEAWGLHSGVYTPRQLVESFAPLLDVVVHGLGSNPPNSKPSRVRLLDNLAANLATDTREATLRLAEPLDVTRQEMKDQATRIGKSLVHWARESHTKSFDPSMYLRSPCEGHLLIPSNVDLMFGDRSQPHLMQLFNEYMHQMVLLRDALLPFQNYQDVLIPIDGKAARGIRHLESTRAQFLSEMLTKHTTQKGVMSYAKSLLAPTLFSAASVGYGFQYAHGTVLPSFLAGGATSLHLLQYIPAIIEPSTTDILFDYQFEDYYSAPLLEIPAGMPIDVSALSFPGEEPSLVEDVSVGLLSSSEKGGRLELRIEFKCGKCAAIDLGQIARGHRYSYFARQSNPLPESTETLNGATTEPQKNPASVIFHHSTDIFKTPNTGLLSAKAGGVHVIPAVDPIVTLAILGRLYPENVILLPRNEGLSQTENAGKGFEPKFVIWGGVERGGLKGVF
ncbi:hypothetical protein N7474_006315 [Penicillium riverlandense]|uniref:uncharacterized protein n=1 Tax=Penicillium riverlandense TaxID=1903569 RepID=UPI002547BCC5|nr:uncharacterized protein N7474_006315 [Penicillium riverlandense]KAJ5814538.1 hypothetical protein N7474_006315 [Penicillium riverlandense]